MTKVLHGSYGDRWAFRIAESGFAFLDGRGWYMADNEPDAIEKANEELRTWNRHLVTKHEVVFDRVEVPVRAPRCEGLEGTSGSVDEGGVEIEFGGACPVQGEGTLDGLPIYYRARGSGWSLTVRLSEHESWHYGEDPYAWPDGGWIAAEESIANIKKAVAAFRKRLGGRS